METPTLAKLNEDDNPKKYGGQCDGDDGRGNQLWSFPNGKVANRFEYYAEDSDTSEHVVVWDNDITGWNYTEEYALD